MNGVAASTVLVVLLGAAAWRARRAPVRWRGAGRAGAARSRLRVLPHLRRTSSSLDAGEVAGLRASLASGRSLPRAFDDLANGGGPWAGDAAIVGAQLRAGRSQADAIDGWAERIGDSARLVADALSIARATGASQVAALDGAAVAISERAALRREVRALSSQAVASCAVIVSTPILFALVVATVDPRVRAFSTSSLVGVACVASGLALDVVGAWWMARLVRSVR